ncbi:T9SS-dependent M36 family metallopeptidase [Flavobacterium sp.]|uniref:T9SS-dependent M36 family metallopeptidase n=1 Tax=Flavobacterium sp. TaxID=239 RepID=UPI002B4B4F51|nr:T9SS-dependent M36 family metallopeptidase [Flavobacterium sp.]HLF51037.1 T9SS-dependent M36 family metallopeptidase [Flavobacterium sp.]
MKKITLLFLFLIPFIGFSQSNNEKIQNYLNANYTKLDLTNNDINDWIVESEASSTSTNINNFYVKQRYNGTEIFGAVSNFWIKNGEVINVGSRFVDNVAQKANAVTPTLSVLQALSKAITVLEISNSGSFEIIETKSPKEFKISNGVLVNDPISAELVYQFTADNKLKLAWDFTIYAPGFQHLWSVRIDALDGKMLEKNDMVISCSFGEKSNHATHDHSINFTKTFFKETQSVLQPMAGSYRVIPFNIESPNHGPRQLISNPENATASPYGWHDTNGATGAEFTYTRGNNVYAQEDGNTNNGTGISPDGTASLTFDFPYGGVTAQPSTYLSAATTNLFYMNNIMHDVFYQYGFNEINGNFQKNNYGNGGATSFLGDAVFADSQDGSTSTPQNLNNANFSTPVDGSAPRMQMYLWSYAAPIHPLTINSPADIAGTRQANDNVFSPGHVNIPVAPALIQSNLVLYDDGTPDPGTTDNADGCGPAVNAAAINGKIVVIRRSLAEASGGTPCAFTEKVKNAQNAGATAVIIVNNVGPSPTVSASINMSGADATITIPAISVTQAIGEALITRIKMETVNGKLQLGEAPFVNSDGDFDNVIIAHEYGHGISTRLTGGPANSSCLQSSEQMGEGWSDFFALMLQMKAADTANDARGIGTFVSSQPTTGSGIRQYKYSPDMAVNPFTFGDTNGMQYNDADGNPRIDVHSVGSVWATILWDLAWAYRAKYGFDSNIYNGTGGNNKVLRLVVDALKLQPCNPSFVSGRDAILAADQATTGGQNYCMIWQVFARRGLGVNASSGTNSGVAGINDQTEDFTEPAAGPNCTLSIDYFENSNMIKVYPNPSNGQVNIHIAQFTGKINLQVVDINGRVVYNVQNDNFNIDKTIDLSHLQSGIYILKINGEELNHTQKIILN